MTAILPAALAAVPAAPTAEGMDQMGLYFNNRPVLNRIQYLRSGSDYHDRARHQMITNMFIRVQDQAQINQSLRDKVNGYEQELQEASGGRIYHTENDRNLAIIRQRYEEWAEGNNSSNEEMRAFLDYAEKCYLTLNRDLWQLSSQLRKDVKDAQRMNREMNNLHGRVSVLTPEDVAGKAFAGLALSICYVWIICNIASCFLLGRRY